MTQTQKYMAKMSIINNVIFSSRKDSLRPSSALSCCFSFILLALKSHLAQNNTWVNSHQQVWIRRNNN